MCVLLLLDRVFACLCCLVTKSSLTLATAWTVARQAPLSIGFPRKEARILEGVAISFSRGLSNPEIELACPALTGRFFTTEPQGMLCTIYSTQLIDGAV